MINKPSTNKERNPSHPCKDLRQAAGAQNDLTISSLDICSETMILRKQYIKVLMVIITLQK